MYQKPRRTPRIVYGGFATGLIYPTDEKILAIWQKQYIIHANGSVAERLNAPVLKTGVGL